MRCLSHPEYYFINLSSSPPPPPFKHLSFGNNPSNSGITIQQSCNGLLLCRGPNGKKPRDHFVYNPTSQKYTLLPPPPVGNGVCCLGFNLAFDPSTSPHYKMVCFGTASIHWIHERDKSLYFNIDEEKIQQMPMPLFLMEGTRGASITSEFLEYCVDLHQVAAAFPEMGSGHLNPGDFNYYKFSTLCVVRGENEEDSYLVVHLPGKIEIYSSQTDTWRLCNSGFIYRNGPFFMDGVFWNNAIYWYKSWSPSIYFDMDEEEVREMPMPPNIGGWNEKWCWYMGASRSHLLLIEIYSPSNSLFKIEKRVDCSRWFVKYQVDLHPVVAAFPEMVRNYRYQRKLHYYLFSTLCVVREENDEDSYLVLHLPTKVIRYNFKDNSFRKIHDFTPSDSEFQGRPLSLSLLLTTHQGSRSCNLAMVYCYVTSFRGRGRDYNQFSGARIEIYSPETGPWRLSGGTFTGPTDTNFNRGVFWKGAIHWICPSGTCFYFNVDEEKLRDMPMPPIPEEWDERRRSSFGESGGHLHLIENYGPGGTVFNVLEMERDYSGWFVKYKVDLFGEENDEDSYLVVQIPKKVIRYNFKDQTFKKIHDFAPSEFDAHEPELERFDVFQHIESLACV
ncbi:hypothetical protein Patl1_20714 [Pistacia atlantica]|uniref:Uncharacterized protein n=1 Tax=Pistacia atlantica TaxID=434234 RepID=A0ACC1BLK1_9ROSI|nr:hypothetical protein Patl1_20714 [Pistacia atlantica]